MRIKISEMRYCEASLWDKPFGEIRYTWKNSDPEIIPSAYALTRQTFTDQYSYMDDPSTAGVEGFGLMFYQSRFYDPSLGRFTSADTIVPAGVQGYDRYAYVNNSPVNFTDPTGHTTSCSTGDCGADGSSGSDSEPGVTIDNSLGVSVGSGSTLDPEITSDGGCTETGYCLPVKCDYYGECYMEMPTGPYGIYINSDPEAYNFLISNPRRFSHYLMTRIDHTERAFTIGISYGFASIVGSLEEQAINYFGESIASNTFQEIGGYIDQASIDGKMDVYVSVIPKEYYMGGPYTNLDNKPLFYEGGLTVVLIQGVGSNQVRPIIIQDVYYPELMYTLGNQP